MQHVRRTQRASMFMISLFTALSVLFVFLNRQMTVEALFGVVLLPLLIAFVMIERYLARATRASDHAALTRMDGIKRANEELEQRVRERTRDLTTTNLALQAEVDGRRRAETQLSLATGMYCGTNEGVVVTDVHGTIQSVNAAFTEVTGYSPEEIVGQNMAKLRSDRHDEAFYKARQQTITASGKWEGEIWNRHKNGTDIPQKMHISTVRNRNGVIQQYVVVLADLSLIKKAEQQVQFLAHHDPLTGLPNRTLLLDRMQLAFAYAQRFEQLVAVLFLGLDRFKATNELVGRMIGDLLLQEVGNRLTHHLRDEDTLARIGGDEFVILATGLQEVNNVTTVVQKIMDSFTTPFLVGGELLYLSTSIGIVVYPFDQGDLPQYLKNAESAMSQAKASGGGSYQFYTREMGVVSAKRLAVEKGLRHALERNELFLNYQPQIDVASGRLVGVEALIRWRSPELGLVSPANFVPLAEESNLIVAIGEWVLRTACSQAMAWQAEGFAPIRVAVNLSGRQFQYPGLMESIERALHDTGLDPVYLELELTEGMFMGNVRGTVGLLYAMKEKGVQLSIDDFGTGYSSLSYLKKFPVHTLKIDQAFVRDITEDQDDAAITRTIIAMAKSLNLQVVAEGVAAIEQLEYLRALGCDIVQGFLFSPPVSPEEISFFLEEDQAIRQTPAGNRVQISKLLSENGKIIPFPNRHTTTTHTSTTAKQA